MSDIWRTKERMAQRYLHARRKGWPRLGPATRSLRLELESAPGNVSRVHAIGVGTKNETDEPAVVVYVTRKLPMDVVPLTDRIPESMNGVRTDVVERPQARLAACTDRRRRQSRPLVGGISISREDGPSGTLGTFVTPVDHPTPPACTSSRTAMCCGAAKERLPASPCFNRALTMAQAAPLRGSLARPV